MKQVWVLVFSLMFVAPVTAQENEADALLNDMLADAGQEATALNARIGELEASIEAELARVPERRAEVHALLEEIEFLKEKNATLDLTIAKLDEIAKILGIDLE